jgi:acetate kinase
LQERNFEIVSLDFPNGVFSKHLLAVVADLAMLDWLFFTVGISENEILSHNGKFQRFIYHHS